MNNSTLLMEIASKPAEETFSRNSINDIFSQILRAESCEGRHFQNIHDLFNDMEDKDAHLYSCLQTRKIGVVSRERKIIAASDSERDREIARFVEKALFRIPFFDQALMNILDAVGKGFSISEIIWKISSEGKITISSIKSRYGGRFTYDENNNLRIINPSREYIAFVRNNSGYAKTAPAGSPPLELHNSSLSSYFPTTLQGYPVPPCKFIAHTFNSRNENPYGRGLCLKAYWHYWFKKNNLKFWAIFNEKFGSPTVIGKYRPNASEEERTRLLEVVESLQNDTGVAIPENVALEFLEAKRSGAVNSYKDLAEWCNSEISKLVLGQTLTSAEGRRSGSMALGKVHENVRMEYVESDAGALSDLMNSTIIKWLVDFNFSGVKDYPKFVIDTSDTDSLYNEIEIDKMLVGMGVPIPTRHFYEKYKRPQPLDSERYLRYDDNNLFQYHLQYGILSINEVRKTLGLNPVPWGDVPPNITDIRAAQNGEKTQNPAIFEKGEINQEEVEEEKSPDER